MDARELRAQQVVARGKITRHDGYWIVAGHSGHAEPARRYKVILDGGVTFCSCEDFELRGKECKHVIAVREVQRRQEQQEWDWESGEIVQPSTPVDPEPPLTVKRKTYKQDWPKYNAAQQTEKDHLLALLADLCRTVPEPARKPGKGRKPVSLADAAFAVAFKVYSGFSARRFTCDLEDAERRGHIGRAMHYNIVLKSLENPALTPVLTEMIHKSALPLRAVETQYAVDSSGFCTSRFTRWFDVKYGVKVKADWVKIHALVGTKTNVVVTAIVLDQHAGDPTQLPPLVTAAKELGFDLKEVSADKAYSTNTCFEAVEQAGGTLYAAFKSNATGRTGGLYGKAFHFFSLHREEFLAHYHRRSNVESTFSMVKRKFGDSVRSKTDVAMTNEALAKLLCHNLCCLVSAWHELGVEADFGPPATAVDDEEGPAVIRFPSRA